MSNLHKVSIWRGGADGHYERFEVPARASQTVLDVVTWVQRHLDQTLTYRFACRVGMCGSCSMRVNGRNCWTCRTSVEKFKKDILVIEPLPHYPVIRDLVVDMHPFFENHHKIVPQFVPAKSDRKGFAKVSCNSQERREIDQHIALQSLGSKPH